MVYHINLKHAMRSRRGGIGTKVGRWPPYYIPPDPLVVQCPYDLSVLAALVLYILCEGMRTSVEV